MSTRELPEEIIRFLDAHIDAYEQLEVLLLLHAKRDGLALSELAAAIGIEPEVANEAAQHLVEHGLLRRARSSRIWHYAPARPEDGRTVDLLVRVYVEDRVLLLRTLTTSSLERLRRSTLRTFAEAFRLRRPKNDG
jgi:predicted ArsR family transcriptional regulator